MLGGVGAGMEEGGSGGVEEGALREMQRSVAAVELVVARLEAGSLCFVCA